ncbi:MAG: TonB family protein [Spirochaetales bacterium]|nr:TonB family protein [Spirochaetales bacterium]
MKKVELILNSWKVFVFTIAIIIHLILILTITISTGKKETRKDNTIFKMVDVEEYIPPEPIKEEPAKLPPKPIVPEEQVEVTNQDDITEDIIETEKEVVEVEVATTAEEVIDYLPQHKISDPPGIPTEEILKRVVYPTLANKQKIEGVVFLELYIDKTGAIRNIEVIKDPGFGLAEAAIDAISGLRCSPAMANGEAVAVRFRYPVRFKLK